MATPEHKENTVKYVGHCGVCSYTFEAKTIGEAESLCSSHLQENRNPKLGPNEKLHLSSYTEVKA